MPPRDRKRHLAQRCIGPPRLAALLVALLATATLAGGLAFSGTTFSFVDCAVGGSASQNVTAGTYLLRTFDSDVFLCQAATCAAGGERFAAGLALLLEVPGQPGSTTAYSCRSAASTGDVILSGIQK